MKIYNLNKVYNQKLERFRQELSIAELSDTSNNEYIEILSKHTLELLSILEDFSRKDCTLLPIQELFKIMYDQLPQPTCIIEPGMKIIYHNLQWKKHFGHGKTIFQLTNFFPANEIDNLEKHLQQTDNEWEHKQQTLHGIENSYEISIIPFKPNGIKLSYLLLLLPQAETISNNRVQQKKLTKTETGQHGDFLNENQSEFLLNAIDGFYFTLNSEYKFLQVSQKIEEKLGYKSESMQGETIESILSAKHSREFKEKLITAGNIEDRLTAFTVKYDLELKAINGFLQTYELTLTKNLHSKQDDPAYVGVFIDINQRKENVNVLEAARNKAEESDKLKSDFLANMSHEIRTPLNGIVGFSNMLNRSDLNDEKREKYIRIIQSSTRQLLALVNDIIDISKIEADQLKMISKRIDIHQLIDELFTSYQEEIIRLGKNNIVLVKDYPGEPILYINTDEIRLKQVLSNLLNNALKFTDEGVVVLGYSRCEDTNRLKFFVRDTGMGIPESKLNVIFSRYKQTSEGEKAKYQGAGLGLAISKGIVRLMGGEIGATSKIAGGSEFYFTIPIDCNPTLINPI